MENGFYWIRYKIYHRTRDCVEVAQWDDDHWLLAGSESYYGEDFGLVLDDLEVISPKLEPPDAARNT